MKSTLRPFTDLELSAELLDVVAELGLETMTPVQAEALPLLLKGHDLVGQSKTGSGKTLAFALNVLTRLQVDYREPQALILCPTRELCTQVAREMRKLGRKLPGLQVVILSGGQPGKPQAEALRAGAQILVGTPGRVLDHSIRGNLDLGLIATVVLDEADRMLDMGFHDEVARVLEEIPRTRQTIFFSATYPESIQELSRRFQMAPSIVKIDEPEEAKAQIEQRAWIVDNESKVAGVLLALKRFDPPSTLVFCNMKVFVDEVVAKLLERGVSATGLHGDLEQSERDRTLAKFRNGSTRVLVATDVAARGLDIDHLDLVINFDLPHQADTYVHRIGRTGRAGKSGVALAFASTRDTSRLMEIERVTGFAIEREVIDRKDLNYHERATVQSAPASSAAMRTLYIGAGRKDKLRPGDILGALTGEAGGLEGSVVGKIEIHDRFAYVAVSQSVAEQALDRLRAGRIKGKKLQVRFVE